MKKKFPIIILCSICLFCLGACQIKKDQLTLNTDCPIQPPFEMSPIKTPSFSNNQIVVTDCGAVGDGIVDNTVAINMAISKLSEDGGGTVIIPSGVWLTGPIQMANNINLHTNAGALIVFNPDYTLYPIIETSFEGLNTHRCMSPISARNVKNIAITGSGVFEGSGDAWRAVKKGKVTERQWRDLIAIGGLLDESSSTWYPSEQTFKGSKLSDNFNNPQNISSKEDWKKIHHYLRPVMVSIANCQCVLLEGVTFRNSPSWGIHPLLTEDLTIKNVNVFNPYYAQNGDGIDIESCNRVLLENSFFDVGDDAICIKSGKDKVGRDRGVASKNVIVNNCTVLHGHGGFVVGSEMSGGVENIYVINCNFDGTDVGLRFKSTRGRGGVVKNVYIDNISMVNIKTDAVLFNLFYGGKSAVETLDADEGQYQQFAIPEVTEETPEFKNISIKNVYCRGARRAMYFNGLPEMKVKNVTIDNVTISSKIGAQVINAENVIMNNVTIVPETGEPFVVSESSKIFINGKIISE